MQNQPQVCCPKFDPMLWDGKVLEWSEKKFIKGRVFTLFYMPLNFGQVMRRLQEKTAKAGGAVLDGMWLADHTSKWSMDVYVAVDTTIADTENTTLSGKFLCKVYEGDFKNTGTWMKDFDKFSKENALTIVKTYLWYTTCPKCAKQYGKNYVVLVGQIG